MVKDEIDQNLDGLINGLKTGVKVRPQSQQYFDDMEWWMLVAIMRDPEILDEISKIIADPKMLKGASDETPHSLIFRAITDLRDDGLEPHFEALYAECEKIRESNPLIKSYSRNSIIELDFQATIRVARDPDNNRIRGKFCAEQILRRK